MNRKKRKLSFKDVVVLVSVVFALVGLVVFVGSQYSGEYDKGYKKGYMAGSNQTQLYYDATGVFPYQQWKDKHYLDQFNSTQEIMDSLGEDNG